MQAVTAEVQDLKVEIYLDQSAIYLGAVDKGRLFRGTQKVCSLIKGDKTNKGNV
jgi:hypothetical protein